MKTPIYKMLKRYAGNRMRFHTPGHKGGGSLSRLSKYDITELSFSDDIMQPVGAVKRSLQTLSEVYSGKAVRILTCGVTSGVLAMLSILKGKKLLLSRYSHKSVLNALQLFDITPIWLSDRLSRDILLPELNEIEEKLQGADAILLTYPDYYGRCVNLKAVAERAKRFGKMLLVDSAHGAHFAYSKRLPDSASEYADVCVFGVHKTCMAFTQTALIVSAKAYEEEVFKAVRRIHSTSPSYLLAVSEELSDAYMRKNYDRLLRKQIELREKYQPKLHACGLRIQQGGDLARFVVDVSLTGQSGSHFAQVLEKRGIYPEMSDFTRVVFLFTPADSVRKIKKLFRMLIRLCQTEGGTPAFCDFDGAVERVYDYTARFETENICFSNAEGRISGCDFGLYPPGVPIVLRGERISGKVIQIMKDFQGHTFGIENDNVEVAKWREN